MMIKYILITSIFALTACAGMKERRANKDKVETVADEPISVTEVKENENQLMSRPAREEDMMNIQGTVRLGTTGCPVIIEMIDGDLYSKVFPLNLDKRYYTEGLKLKFDYGPTTQNVPESCIADKVVTLTNVEIIK